MKTNCGICTFFSCKFGIVYINCLQIDRLIRKSLFYVTATHIVYNMLYEQILKFVLVILNKGIRMFDKYV